MIIAVGSDHAAYGGAGPDYKPEIIKHLQNCGHDVIDCGTNGPESVDYSDYAAKVCENILGSKAEKGVLICGTGIGIAIAANRFKGIRAATCATPEMARLASEHNDANIIALGSRILSIDECLNLIDIWLETPFSDDDRHKRRIDKIG